MFCLISKAQLCNSLHGGKEFYSGPHIPLARLPSPSRLTCIVLHSISADLHFNCFGERGHHCPDQDKLGALQTHVWYISVTIPKLSANFIAEDRSISFVGCMTQLFFFSSFMCTECVLLSAMAYDRYVAICQPLHSPVMMTYQMCIYLLKFCGPHAINHFFCDISSVLNLACTDMSLAEMVDFCVGLIHTACSPLHHYCLLPINYHDNPAQPQYPE
ncbi:hypothetical protein QYF61_019301 [Mycteria americana]|uniref:G-protein coupled receptors family 1 profile domain-containing protein n=1 Tax=Mycteria americana TaxID=33587 RepID=A0AAN7N8P5_MYCAM|nr:hypothetical protein QYF61_019301 [Mycteria americana]